MGQSSVDLVKNSWKVANYNDPAISQTFFARLFEVDPSLRSLFKENISVQAEKLQSMLDFVIDNLGALQEIENSIIELGQTHSTSYGVTKEHYSTVGSALIWSLKKSLGREWTPELESAWIEIYGILEDRMTTPHSDISS